MKRLHAVSLLGLSALGACLSACLAVPDNTAPECKVTSDCDTVHGEVCDEGVCYGNPPAGSFVAVVSPPSERKTDLVSRELGELVISADGQLGDIALEEPVTYSGQLRLLCPAPLDCSEVPLAASITVTRPALFAGGPGFRAVVETEPRTGKFDLVVPRTRDNDAPFTITVVPAGRGDDFQMDAPLTGQMVPPLRTELSIPDSETGKTLDVGAIALPTIEGTLTNSVGVGLTSYRVVALGRWDINGSLTEVSTVDYTGNDGKYSLRLSEGIVGPVEIVAKPFGQMLEPTLRAAGVPATGAFTRNLVAPASLGKSVELNIPVKGAEPGGEVGPISGARVTVVGIAPGNTVATVVAEATTGDDGLATVKLLDGAAFASNYRISIVPPASARVGVIFNEHLILGGKLEQHLPDRVALRGVVRDVAGAPIKDVQVTVQPSLRFEWSLDAIPQAFLSTIPAATTVTLDTGEFVVFVDPFLHNDDLVDIWGTYDLAFEPTAATNAPSWMQGEIEIPRDVVQTTITLPDIALPDAAHVHGRITDPSGNSVEGAELKIFRVDPSLAALCGEVNHAPNSCPIPALLMGRGASDGDGAVRLTLPR